MRRARIGGLPQGEFACRRMKIDLPAMGSQETPGPCECPVCRGEASVFAVFDFNKCCEEVRGTFLPPSGLAVHYFLCPTCAFCFAPSLRAWDLEQFAEHIYNDEYVKVDPDWIDVRAKINADNLVRAFAEDGPALRHLDFGGGNGALAGMMRDKGWNSASYDPFVDRDTRASDLGKFDLVTAFEVFEHVPDVRQLASDLSTLLADDGLVLFSTQLSDGVIRPGKPLVWWYASPRNGHISLFSSTSLRRLGAIEGFELRSLQHDFHLYWRRFPQWARRLVGS